jgi:hypothetical protein
MTGVGSVADIVQLPAAEISTDNATSSPTTPRAAPAPPPGLDYDPEHINMKKYKIICDAHASKGQAGSWMAGIESCEMRTTSVRITYSLRA